MVLDYQEIFAMDTKKEKNIITHEFGTVLFQISPSKEKPAIKINKNFSPLNVLSILIGGNNEI